MSPSLARRLASLAYESLLVAAIVIGGAFAFFGAIAAIGGALSGRPSIGAGPGLRALFQLFVVLLLAGYFVRSWTRGGQTLAMRAWRLRVLRPDGTPLCRSRATGRFLLALALIGPAPIAAAHLWRHADSPVAWLAAAPAIVDLAWALVDRERQFLHDRLAGTRIVLAGAAPPPGTGRATGR